MKYSLLQRFTIIILIFQTYGKNINNLHYYFYIFRRDNLLQLQFISVQKI